MTNCDGKNRIPKNTRFQVIISPISISRADGMNRLFIQKSILWTNCSNEANNNNDHNIIVIVPFFRVERSQMMATEKHCMVGKIDKKWKIVIK